MYWRCTTLSAIWRQSLVALTASPTTVQVGGQTNLTAQSPVNVGATPYDIIIYNPDTGIVEGSCGSGTACAVSVSDSIAELDKFQAVVGTWTSSGPVDIPATGNPAYVNFVNGSSSVAVPPPGTQDVNTPTAGIPCDTNWEPPATEEPYAEVVFRNNCTLGNVDWIITLQPYMQATVGPSGLNEYGIGLGEERHHGAPERPPPRRGLPLPLPRHPAANRLRG